MVQSDASAIITTSAVSVYIVQLLKKWSKIKFINESSHALNTCLSVVLAIASSIGIATSFDQTNGILTITGLTLQGVLAGGWAALKSFVMNQLIYHGVTAKANGNGAGN